MQHSKYKLSEPTIDKLKYYVYLLKDPRDNSVFYVGKGCGNRIINHLSDALKEKTTETKKLKRIRKIQKAGFEVELIILRHGLEEQESFHIESALIDFIGIENLTNLVLGNDSSQGTASLLDLKIKYEPVEAFITAPVVLINLNQSFKKGMGVDSKELYNISRKHWKANLNRIKDFKWVLVHSNGIIRGIYNVEKWIQSKEVLGRVEFTKKEPSSIFRRYMHAKYLFTSVKNIVSNSQNPIFYIDENYIIKRDVLYLKNTLNEIIEEYNQGIPYEEVIIKDGQFPYAKKSEKFNEFLKYLIKSIIPLEFEWSSWQKEAENLVSNPELIKIAELETLRKLIFTHLRKSRFIENYFSDISELHHLSNILNRIDEIVK